MFEELALEPFHHVGVIGVKTIGRQVLLFAKDRGCTVTAFSREQAQEEEILLLGADHFVWSGDPKRFERLKETFDCLLTSPTIGLDFDGYLQTLKPGGTLYLLGDLDGEVSFPMQSLQNKTVKGIT